MTTLARKLQYLYSKVFFITYMIFFGLGRLERGCSSSGDQNADTAFMLDEWHASTHKCARTLRYDIFVNQNTNCFKFVQL